MSGPSKKKRFRDTKQGRRNLRGNVNAELNKLRPDRPWRKKGL